MPLTILTRPQWREVARALRLGYGSQRRDGGSRQWKWRRDSADRSDLAHQAVDDATGGPAGEHIRERGALRSIAVQRGAMHGARGGFRTKQVGRAYLHARDRKSTRL